MKEKKEMKTKKTICYTFVGLLIVLPLLAGLLVVYSYWSYPRNISTATVSTTEKLQLSWQKVKTNSIQTLAPYQFWVNNTGPIGPLYTGPKQNPFICTTFQAGLGQPIIDTEQEGSSAVFPELFGYPLIMLPPIGYSKNCSIPTRIDYFYYSRTQQKFILMDKSLSIPKDVEYIDQYKNNLHERLPFVVRLERGTINRFLYGIAMLAPYSEFIDTPQNLDNSAWNGKLVYKFQGGIGIGHFQGYFSLNKKHALHYASLKRGFAVAYSSGTRTTTHYNLKLAEETAYMLKQHFISTYGKPIYTVGLGGSGGAIQQHIIAQNNPEVIDAAIPQASFPDMITQTIAVADCELLERYFDHEYASNPDSRWSDWTQRVMVQGGAANQTAQIEKWRNSSTPFPGSSECVSGWRGSIPMVFNPYWTHPAYFKALDILRFKKSQIQNVQWNHWHDLYNIYSANHDSSNVSRIAHSWDNVGVQYGLLALKKGELSKQAFLDLNACVGGWKQTENMVAGAYPWNRKADKKPYDPWDQANMNLSAQCKNGIPAPRTTGNTDTMNMAYSSGHVFSGNLSIPTIDIRWYLEPILDMHNTVASFATRARIQSYNGHSDNHIIWVAECSDLDTINLKRKCRYEPTGDALDVIDEWMKNITNNPSLGVVNNKPSRAKDSCIDKNGSIIYSGKNAWDGILNDNHDGICTQKFPPFSTSRLQAGANIQGNTFKCALKPVSKALDDDNYGSVTFSQQELARLNTIFPNGVCDYSQPDRGLPGKANGV